MDTGEVQVSIDSQTHYANFEKLSDLKEGDKVRIEFRLTGPKKTAATITKLEDAVTQESQTTTTTTTTVITNSATVSTP